MAGRASGPGLSPEDTGLGERRFVACPQCKSAPQGAAGDGGALPGTRAVRWAGRGALAHSDLQRVT